ncbi:MAG: hypothetical protein QM817_19590 [Archangium sp.]
MLNVALALALSAAPPLVNAEGVALDENGKKPFEAPFLGVQVDVGAPDGIGASLVATPGRYFRIHAGGLNNGVGSGVRFGVTFIAFPENAFRPLLGGDLGYVFGGAGAWLPQLINDATVKNAISGIDIAYGNAQVGFELGSPHVAFTFRAGISYLRMIADRQEVATGANSSVTVSGIAINAVIPSARLGLIVCF